MSSSGLIYAVIVGAWAVYLVPMWLRREDELNRARQTQRYAAAIKVLSNKEAFERRWAKTAEATIELPLAVGQNLLPQTRSAARPKKPAAKSAAKPIAATARPEARPTRTTKPTASSPSPAPTTFGGVLPGRPPSLKPVSRGGGRGSDVRFSGSVGNGWWGSQCPPDRPPSMRARVAGDLGNHLESSAGVLDGQ